MMSARRRLVFYLVVTAAAVGVLMMLASVLGSLGSATSDSSMAAELQRLQQLPVEEVVAEALQGLDIEDKALLTEVVSALEDIGLGQLHHKPVDMWTAQANEEPKPPPESGPGGPGSHTQGGDSGAEAEAFLTPVV